MEPAEASSSLACVVLTTMGRVLVQCEGDTTLPFHYTRLTLLLASCLQFATSHQEYARLDLQNGFSVVVSVDAAASIACAVIVKESQGTELARLQSLVVLKEFLRVFRERVDKIVEANRVAAAEMAEAYTLTSALGGAGSRGMDGYEDEDGTLEEFQPFHHEFVARVLELRPSDSGDQVVGTPTSEPDGVGICQAGLANGEIGAWVQTTKPRPGISLSTETATHAVQELVRRATRAMHQAFPVLGQGGGVALASGFVSVSNSSRPSATTLVLHIRRSSTDRPSYYVAIRMLELGVFAAVVHYCVSSSCDRFRGNDCELLRDDQLPRVLVSDPRGAALLRLLQDAKTSTSFAVHMGSDVVPETVSGCLEDQLRPWRVRFDSNLPEK